MKTVFNNSELAHVYANQSQSNGRNSNGSMFFEGSTIYSYGYHFAIATIETNQKGIECMLFTTRSYSNTTAKQISIVRNATRQFEKVFCYNPKGSNDENFNAWIREAEYTAQKLQKAKKPEIYLNELGHIQRQSNEYAHFKGVEIPETLKALLNIQNKAQFAEYAERKAEFAKAEKIRKEKEQKREFKEQIKKWFAGEVSRLYTNYKLDFLRLNDNRVETTQAVQIPVEIAKRLYLGIKNETIKEGDKVLNYTINEVGEKIRIGCHTFTKKYLLHFGAQLN